MSEAPNFSLNMRKAVKFRNLRQKRDGEPDTMEICKCHEDAHYSALQCLQIIERKWFNRFHSRDRQLCKFMGQKRNLHRKRVQILKRWRGLLAWEFGVGTFPLSALFYRYYNYQFLSNIDLVPTLSMAKQFQLHGGIWVRDLDKDNIWTLLIFWPLKIILPREHLSPAKREGESWRI